MRLVIYFMIGFVVLANQTEGKDFSGYDPTIAFAARLIVITGWPAVIFYDFLAKSEAME